MLFALKQIEWGPCPRRSSAISRFQWSFTTTRAIAVPARMNGPCLNVRHDERAERAVIAAVSDTHMAKVVLTGLHLITREQVACWNVKPAGDCLNQLIAGHGKATHIAAAG
jgi:hypothetical protein